MLLPDQPPDERERGASVRRAATSHRRTRHVGPLVVVTAGLFVVVTLTVVWLWSSVDLACDSAEVAAVTPICDGAPGQP